VKVGAGVVWAVAASPLRSSKPRANVFIRKEIMRSMTVS
jgi:hypothetical protein